MSDLVKYMKRFDIKEKAVMCRLVREYSPSSSPQYATMNHALLPFMKASSFVTIISSVYLLHCNPADVHFAKKILAKIPELWADFPRAKFRMALDSVKVFKHFGSNPERGKPLSILPKVKVTVGTKWSLPKRAWVDDNDVLVTPCVALKRTSLNSRKSCIWEVQVLARYRYAVELWLLENCV